MGRFKSKSWEQQLVLTFPPLCLHLLGSGKNRVFKNTKIAAACMVLT